MSRLRLSCVCGGLVLFALLPFYRSSTVRVLCPQLHRPRRSAQWSREAVFKSRTARCQRVEVWRLVNPARATERRNAEVVGEDENDVGPGRLWRSGERLRLKQASRHADENQTFSWRVSELDQMFQKNNSTVRRLMFIRAGSTTCNRAEMRRSATLHLAVPESSRNIAERAYSG